MSYSNEIFENVPIGTEVVTVSATDTDSGKCINRQFDYSIFSYASNEKQRNEQSPDGRRLIIAQERWLLLENKLRASGFLRSLRSDLSSVHLLKVHPLQCCWRRKRERLREGEMNNCASGRARKKKHAAWGCRTKAPNASVWQWIVTSFYPTHHSRHCIPTLFRYSPGEHRSSATFRLLLLCLYRESHVW